MEFDLEFTAICAPNHLQGGHYEHAGRYRGTLRIGTILDPEFTRLGAFLKQLVESNPQVDTVLRQGMSGDVLAQMYLASCALKRFEDEGRPDIAGMVEIHTLCDDWSAEIDGVSVAALRVDHPPVTDCFALRFDSAAYRVVFSSDTCHFPPLGRFAEGADVLVHEAMLTAGVDKLVARTGGATRLREHLLASHTQAEDVGRIAASAMVGHLVLHHLVPADDPDFGEVDWRSEVSKTWNGPLTVGRDGMVVPIGKASE